jgi:hypothetical protein
MPRALSYFTTAFGAGAPFFRAAHRAFIAAANRALPSGLNVPFFFGADAVVNFGAATAAVV